MKFFEGKNIKGKKESGSQKSGKKFKSNKNFLIHLVED